jgi:hypothetical protein
MRHPQFKRRLLSARAIWRANARLGETTFPVAFRDALYHRKLAPDTVNRYIKILRMLLKAAHRDRFVLARNSAFFVRRRSVFDSCPGSSLIELSRFAGFERSIRPESTGYISLKEIGKPQLEPPEENQGFDNTTVTKP